MNTPTTLFKPGFLEFYRQSHFSDVTILTKNKCYRAHRLVLAFSSKFFASMLLSDFKETNTAMIDLCKISDPYNIFPEILKTIYSGKIDLTQQKVVPLLAMADALMIKILHDKCMEFISTSLNKSNALSFLMDAIELNQESIAQTCLKVLASSFLHICDHTDFARLDGAYFLQLVTHPRIAVKNEWKLYKVILNWCESNNIQPYAKADNKTSSLLMDLMKSVRFYYLTLEQLIQASVCPYVPHYLLVDPLLARLAALESPKISLPSKLLYEPRLSCGIRFEIEDVDKPKGIIYWLGTQEGTAPWANPASKGIVTIHASSIERGNPHNLVDVEPQELWTQDVPASWLSIDLGKFRVLPHAYMLRHGGNYRADSLRNWDFQGSVDGKSWVALKRHSNDSTLSAPFAVKTFSVDNVSTPYQCFRIIQTGHNSSTHNFLVLSGIELYGELWSAEALQNGRLDE